MNNSKALKLLAECVNTAAEQYPAMAEEYWAALREVSQGKNEPLTLEELGQMENKPVFVIYSSGAKKWHILEGLIDYVTHAAKWKDGGIDGIDDYGKTWLAYRYNPVGMKESEWISVKDRLPTEDDSTGGIVFAVENEINRCAKPWHWNVVVKYASEFTHWMPLPESPRRKQNEIQY